MLLATAYYRLKNKEKGDREQAIAEKLRAEEQAREPGAGGRAGARAPVGAARSPRRAHRRSR